MLALDMLEHRAHYRPMKRLLLLALPVLAVLPFSTAHAAPPTVTKVWRQYSSYTYTVAADHGAISASPYQGQPVTSGGCRLVWHRNARGRVIVDGAACSSAGTVAFTSPDFPVCETPFIVAVDGAAVLTDLLNAPCPPPAPPAVIVVASGDTVAFSNPATISQLASYGTTVPSLACYWSADGGFTSQTSTRFAGIGLNRRAYYWADVSVSVPAGGVVTATLVCPS